MSELPVTVLVVDDSPVSRMLLVHLFESNSQFAVIGAVGDGQAALDFCAGRLPDVIVMDLCMPRMDGLEATRRIMQTRPVPIVICSATTRVPEVTTAFRAMEVGALACVRKPGGPEHVDFARESADLLETVRLMSAVKVVRRWPRPTPHAEFTPPRPMPIRCIGIGASTGGPPVLKTILTGLPNPFPVPILVVQHISVGFLPGLASWLGENSGFAVEIAAHGVRPKAGHVYLAPDDHHLALSRTGLLSLSRDADENGVRPAVSCLFRSLAEHCGAASIGVLLTGMGKDGAKELLQLRQRGAITIAQDRQSSVVYGMPGEAFALDAASQILPAERIADALVRAIESRSGLGELQ